MALELADRLQASVLILRAWSMATAPRRPDWEFGYVLSFDEMSAAVHDHLVNDTATDVARFSHLPMEHSAAHASPAKSLVGLSSEALMLVVGSRVARWIRRIGARLGQRTMRSPRGVPGSRGPLTPIIGSS
jgi:hypothetical protein